MPVAGFDFGVCYLIHEPNILLEVMLCTRFDCKPFMKGQESMDFSYLLLAFK